MRDALEWWVRFLFIAALELVVLDMPCAISTKSSKLEFPNQISHAEIEGICDSAKSNNRNVANPTLDTRNIGPVKICCLS